MKVCVVGAGLAGLFTAVELQRRGIEVVVVDAGDRPGGVARTVIEGGYVLEPAAGGFNLPHPALSTFVDDLALDVVPAVSARTRYLGYDDHIVELPSDPREALISPILSPAAKARLLLETRVDSTARPEETLAGFLTRRFGPEAARLGGHLASSGVFAGDPETMSVLACFPQLVQMEARFGSLIRAGIERSRAREAGQPSPTMHVPVGGMSGLVDELVAYLDGSVMTGFEVTSIGNDGTDWVVEGPDRVTCDAVVCALDPDDAAPILPDALGPLVSGRSHAPVVVVGLGGTAEELPLPDGFGVLSHPDAATPILGALFESSYAPGRAPEGHSLVKVLVGGARRPDVLEWDDDYLVRAVGTDLARMLGTDLSASWTRVVRHSRGIPQYPVGHMAWLDQLDSALADTHRGLHLTGWAYRGVGVASLAADALRIGAALGGEAGS